MHRTTVLVFSKAPVPGLSKTRLIPVLGEEGAARLQRHLIYRTLITATGLKNTQTELHCTPDTAHPVFQICQEKFGVPLKVQQGSDLGDRMYHAAAGTLARGQYVILIGTDCPTLSANYLTQAMAALQDGSDAVLGPALDGGYVLLGLRRVHSSLFSGIDWGTDRVLHQSRGRLERLAWQWRELAPLRDLDRPEDLDADQKLLQLGHGSSPVFERQPLLPSAG